MTTLTAGAPAGRGGLRTWAARLAPRTGRPTGLAVFVLLASVGAADGGYFPQAWNAVTVLALWAIALLLVRPAITRLEALDLAMLGALAGLAAWIGLSFLWSIDPSQTVMEAQRGVLYLSAAGALLLVLRPRSLHHALGGALAAIALLAAYGLATRLFPDRVDGFDPVAGYRLFEPIGYWNALGVVCAIGALLAAGFAARARTAAGRALGAAAPSLLLLTLYFTYSRGSWIVLGVGLVALVALDSRRLQLLPWLAVAGAPAAVGVWLASRAPGLTRQDALIEQAVRDGRRLALWLLLLGALAAAGAVGLHHLERRVATPQPVRRAIGAALGLAALAAAIGVVASQGGPITLTERGYDAFAAAQPEAQVDLNQRLLSFSGNGRADLAEMAWRQYRDHPLLGAGAGSYERYAQAQGSGGRIRDAHNLYLETLGELGWPGLALLLVALGAPVAAGVRARRLPLAPAALAAYLAFLVHAGADWDWEMPAVTLTALIIGAALVAAARRRDEDVPLGMAIRVPLLAVAVLVAGASIVAMVGNRAVAAAADAALEARYADAERHARTAVTWAPYSTRARMLLGQAQGALDRPGRARATLREALRRDQDSWDLWFELARVSEGAARRRALARAEALNPDSSEVAQFKAALEAP